LPNSIEAVGFNGNAVTGNQAGNFAVANGTNVKAIGYNGNNATSSGGLSGNYNV
ncbi:unnamed protein product, partial [Candidula unifasciata]